MMGRPRRKLTKDEFQYLNILRFESVHQAFTLKNLMKKFSELGGGFWRDTIFVKFLVEVGILKRNYKGTYSFDKPFSFEQLELAVHKYQCYNAKYKARWRKKNKKETITVVSEDPNEELQELLEVNQLTNINPIEDAIHLLKENGYRVQIKNFDIDKALQNPGQPVQNFIVWTDC